MIRNDFTGDEAHFPVLIVGGGLAGLTTALLLAWRGIRCLLVERRAGTSLHPRARSVNFRSMELLRGTGVEDEIYAAGKRAAADVTMVIAESVTGKVLKNLFPAGDAETVGFTPAKLSFAGQDRVEPILQRRASELGANVHFSTELVSWEQDAGIQATILDRETGIERRISADYMVAADGNRSPIRERLGIGVHGHGRISNWMSMVFEAESSLPTDGRGFGLYYLQNPAFTGAYTTTDTPRRAVVSVEDDPQLKSPEDFTDECCVEFIQQALGLKIDVRILEKRPWEMSSWVADRFISGRVFLVGDAAHTMPPTGGLGGQTAIQDGADLAWKLALVLEGKATPTLLEAYEIERKPVAELTVDCQTSNYIERMRPDRIELKTESPRNDYLSVALGYRYRSRAIILELPDDGSPVENPFTPTGQPGTRATHVLLARQGNELSTIDLFGFHFVILSGPDGIPWMKAAKAISADLGIPIDLYQIGVDLRDVEDAFGARYGVERDGAVLVRPDGFIGWRSRQAVAAPAQILGEALEQILGGSQILARREAPTK